MSTFNVSYIFSSLQDCERKYLNSQLQCPVRVETWFSVLAGDLAICCSLASPSPSPSLTGETQFHLRSPPDTNQLLRTNSPVDFFTVFYKINFFQEQY